MKNWTRIFLLCSILIGGTVFFVLYSLNRFNKELDNLSYSSFAIANIPPIPASATLATSTEDQISTTTPEIILTSTTSTDLKLSFIFPKNNNEVYIGCTYLLSFQSSSTIHSLETVLIDAGTRETVESIESGLSRENKIEPNSQSLGWKVGVVWPGEYYIKVSNINGVDLESKSKVFSINEMPEGISVAKREKICIESDGSF